METSLRSEGQRDRVCEGIHLCPPKHLWHTFPPALYPSIRGLMCSFFNSFWSHTWHTQWAFCTQSLENTIKTIYDHPENAPGQCQGKGCTSNAAVGHVPGHQHQPGALSTARALQALGKPAGGQTQGWNLAGGLKTIKNASYVLLEDSLGSSLQYFLLVLGKSIFDHHPVPVMELFL